MLSKLRLKEEVQGVSPGFQNQALTHDEQTCSSKQNLSLGDQTPLRPLQIVLKCWIQASSLVSQIEWSIFSSQDRQG